MVSPENPTRAQALCVAQMHGASRYFRLIKHVMKFRQFLLRGITAVRGEWSLVCLAWNMKRMNALCA